MCRQPLRSIINHVMIKHSSTVRWDWGAYDMMATRKSVNA